MITTNTEDLLIGSLVGAAMIVCGSKNQKSIRKYYNQLRRKHRFLQITINLNNVIKGNIDHLHLDHADVAVGVAEKGANVFHHKIEDNGR